MNNNNNGRVNILGPPPVDSLFKLYDKNPVNQCVTLRDATNGIWDNTNLSTVFFSAANMNIIQNGIRAGVYNLSNKQYIIAPQDCETLSIIMRSVFLQNAANQPTNITKQVSDLNTIVINYCIQQVYGEAQGYIKYLEDASTLVIPMSHPVMTSVSDKQLELKSWF